MVATSSMSHYSADNNPDLDIHPTSRARARARARICGVTANGICTLDPVLSHCVQ